MKKTIIARSVNGVDMLRFEYVEETGFFHWHGNANYCGYTEKELLAREGYYI